MMRFLTRGFLAAVVIGALACSPEDTIEAQEMGFEEYTPRSTLVVPENPVTEARFPFVDVHSHQWGDLTADRIEGLIRAMDEMNMAVMVNLSGGTGARLETVVRAMKGPYPNRFVVFANTSFEGIDDPGYSERVANQLRADVAAGAQGLKIFKDLGLTAQDSRGQRIPTDDPRLDLLWQTAGELGIPVLIHTGEPASFFEPHDRFNERWLELKQRPGRARPPEQYPSWEEIMQEQWNVFGRHPNTVFINAHLGWLGNDLGRLGQLLDRYPNVYTETAAVLAELGRQPRSAKAFLERYQDRVMFGKDSWAPVEYHPYFRTLETADEYFPYYRRRHAFWRLYGLDLSNEVLQKLYYQNAARIIPGLPEVPPIP